MLLASKQSANKVPQPTEDPAEASAVSFSSQDSIETIPSSRVLDDVLIPTNATDRDSAKRRARPASYHGAIGGRPGANPLQGHGRTHSGGIRPLHLPLKVASATNSPRLEADVTLPDLDNDDDNDGISTFSTPARGMSSSSSRLASQGRRRFQYAEDEDIDPWPKTAPAGKTRFRVEETQSVPSNRAVRPRSSVPNSASWAYSSFESDVTESTFRQEASEQMFVQHERDALLARIAELELALQKNHGSDVPIIAPSRDPASATGDDRTSEPHSRYPSPPISPTETELMDAVLNGRGVHETPSPAESSVPEYGAHEMQTLQDLSPQHPRLRLISPTLFVQGNDAPRTSDVAQRDSSARQGTVGYFSQQQSEVASPISGNL